METQNLPTLENKAMEPLIFIPTIFEHTTQETTFTKYCASSYSGAVRILIDHLITTNSLSLESYFAYHAIINPDKYINYHKTNFEENWYYWYESHDNDKKKVEEIFSYFKFNEIKDFDAVKASNTDYEIINSLLKVYPREQLLDDFMKVFDEHDIDWDKFCTLFFPDYSPPENAEFGKVYEIISLKKI
jgi:hypothetical protein